MQKNELLRALKRFGELCDSDTEIVLAGGAAMILADYVDRNTGDSDAVFSSPKLSYLKRQIKEVAEEMGLK